MGLPLDSRLDDVRMVGVRDERDDKVMISDRSFQGVSDADIQRDSSRVRETLGQPLCLLEGATGNRQTVLRLAGKVLSSGTGDKTATEEEDLLLLLVGGRNHQGIPAENWSNHLAILKQTPGKLRKDESGLVDTLVVVDGVGDLPHRNLEVPLLVFSTDHETDLTAGVSGNSGEGVFGNGEDFAGGLFQLFDQWSV